MLPWWITAACKLSLSDFILSYLYVNWETFAIKTQITYIKQVQTLNEQDWERAQQASVLANVAQAFESDVDISDGEDDRETIFSSVDILSPSGQADAQTLAMMLQEQLDAINNEIRYSIHLYHLLKFPLFDVRMYSSCMSSLFTLISFRSHKL